MFTIIFKHNIAMIMVTTTIIIISDVLRGDGPGVLDPAEAEEPRILHIIYDILCMCVYIYIYIYTYCYLCVYILYIYT